MTPRSMVVMASHTLANRNASCTLGSSELLVLNELPLKPSHKSIPCTHGVHGRNLSLELGRVMYIISEGPKLDV